MLTQFTDSEGRPTLSDLNYSFPENVYSAGRLDYDSEGLLLLTDDNMLKTALLNPKSGHEKEYLVQVEGNPLDKDFERIRKGIVIEGKMTLPAKIKIIPAPDLPQRIPPVRFRKTVPDTWLSVILTEGRNREVRKLCAAAGFPVLRLVRIRIIEIRLENMQPGDVKELNSAEIRSLKYCNLTGG